MGGPQSEQHCVYNKTIPLRAEKNILDDEKITSGEIFEIKGDINLPAGLFPIRK